MAYFNWLVILGLTCDLHWLDFLGVSLFGVGDPCQVEVQSLWFLRKDFHRSINLGWNTYIQDMFPSRNKIVIDFKRAEESIFVAKESSGIGWARDIDWLCEKWLAELENILHALYSCWYFQWYSHWEKHVISAMMPSSPACIFNKWEKPEFCLEIILNVPDLDQATECCWSRPTFRCAPSPHSLFLLLWWALGSHLYSKGALASLIV